MCICANGYIFLLFLTIKDALIASQTNLRCSPWLLPCTLLSHHHPHLPPLLLRPLPPPASPSSLASLPPHCVQRPAGGHLPDQPRQRPSWRRRWCSRRRRRRRQRRHSTRAHLQRARQRRSRRCPNRRLGEAGAACGGEGCRACVRACVRVRVCVRPSAAHACSSGSRLNTASIAHCARVLDCTSVRMYLCTCNFAPNVCFPMSAFRCCTQSLLLHAQLEIIIYECTLHECRPGGRSGSGSGKHRYKQRVSGGKGCKAWERGGRGQARKHCSRK